MSRLLIVLLTLIATAAVLVLVYVLDVPASVVLSSGFGAVCLLWLLVLLTVPWNLFFKARSLLREIGISRERGMEIPAERDDETRVLGRRLLLAAVGGHVVSAGLLAVIAYFSGAVVGYYFVGFYLVSTGFRPAGAWYTHVRDRLRGMLREVRYPRDDVVDLLTRMGVVEGQLKIVNGRLELLSEDMTVAGERIADLARHCGARDDLLDRRLDVMGRTFEDSIGRLTDNQEVLAGIKAFLRLIRTEQA